METNLSIALFIIAITGCVYWWRWDHRKGRGKR